MRLVLTLAVLAAACGPNPKSRPLPHKVGEPSGALFDQHAEVSNTITADGCAYPITLTGKGAMAPSQDSLTRVRDFVTKQGSTFVSLKYRFTGLSGSVECGFNTWAELDEIEVLAIGPVCGANESFATTCVQCGPAGGCAKEETKCTPTCGGSSTCATGTCVAGVCSPVPACI